MITDVSSGLREGSGTAGVAHGARPNRHVVPQLSLERPLRDYVAVRQELGRRDRSAGGYWSGRMLTARAMTRMPSTSETADCTNMVSFAQRANGSTSVGLKAVAFVNEKYR
jgi:hypothetical protein